MNNSVFIKGTKNGIILKLDPELDFEALQQQVAAKFEETADFFKEANLALSFEGRELFQREMEQLVELIEKHSKIHIICIVENNKFHEQVFEDAINRRIDELSAQTGQFYKGTLRSGQVFESESSVIILGDVNPGAKVIARGNVVVLGALKGNIFAGAGGNENCFVAALDMNPMQIRIGDVLARCADHAKPDKKVFPKIAFVENGSIFIERIDKTSINSINL